MNKTTEKIVCPKCGSSEKIIPLSTGASRVTQKYRDAEKRGECMMAGCVLSVEVPKWFCKACRLNIWESDLHT